MFKSISQIRVRYSETDQMGYVYYGNYATYFEVGRVEALRSLGITYKEMEENGLALPVLDFQIRYFKPALYDDLLSVHTIIPELPGVRIRFEYETYNASGVLLNKAATTLVFLNKQTSRPVTAPDEVLDKMRTYFV